MTVARRQCRPFAATLAAAAACLCLGLAAGGPARAQTAAAAPDSQATAAGAVATPARKAPKTGAKAAAKTPALDLRGAASCSFIYNDNILGAGADDIEAFESGSYPFKFAHESTDDLVVAPGLELELRRDLVALGQSRLRFRVKRWMYVNNPIKTNTDFDFYARQYIGKRQSLELYLHTAPEQYIRQLTDRSPLADPESPLEWREFRFQRNIWNLTWRQAVSRSLAAMLVFERNYRYYNREFMENDIEAWELRGNLAWTVSPVLSLSGDYSYEDGNGRGLDEVGETILDSDDSDPSYERDLYRVEASVAWPKLAKLVDQVSFSFLFMDYYYTTQRSLVEDPYHLGRRDLNYKASVELQRKLSKELTARFSVRRTSRTVESPWEGDLTTDKAFVQWLTWVDLTYRF